jgi:hypothetical protein
MKGYKQMAMDEVAFKRHEAAVRAAMMEESPVWAEAWAEVWQAESVYRELQKTRRRKGFDRAAFSIAKARYEAAVEQMSRAERETPGLRLRAEAEAIRERIKTDSLTTPKIDTDPVAFKLWLFQHVDLYRTAKLYPERVFMVRMVDETIRKEYETRYCLFASLMRVYVSDGVAAAMVLYQEEVRDRLLQSEHRTIETDKIPGDPGRRNQRFDGGYYGNVQSAEMTPIISSPKPRHLKASRRSKSASPNPN